MSSQQSKNKIKFQYNQQKNYKIIKIQRRKRRKT